MSSKLVAFPLIVFLTTLSVATGCRITNASTDGLFSASRAERQCIRSGWEKLSMDIANIKRDMLYKGPEGVWRNGIILILHGGGGEAAHFCAGGKLVQPQIHFAEMAIARGFAVMVLEATNNKVIDAKGRVCGKRFDFSVLDRPNLDLPFIERLLDKTIPERRPAHSSSSVFIAGLSTGGYMTIRAASYFNDRITAFTPISAGDPYGTDTICDTSLSQRKSAKGILVDRETRKEITHNDACLSADYPDESQWPGSKSAKMPAFKQFQHEADGIVDMSCMKKAGTMLVEKGYRDDGAFIINSRARKSAYKHLWLERYNTPILDFFVREAVGQE